MAQTPLGADPTELLAGAVGSWQLDVKATTIELHSKAMWGLAKVRASIVAIEGDGAVAADGAVSGRLVIDAASVDSGNNKRDEHLRSKEFFEVDVHPTLIYTITAAHADPGGKIAVSGTLTVRGETRPLDVLATAAQTDPDRVSVTAEVDVDRRGWGLTWAKMGASVDNHVVVKAVFIRR